MKVFWKFAFPPLYGLLIYFTIRLLHDTEFGMEFWKRSWGLNFFEMGCSVLVGYLGVYLFNRVLRYFDDRQKGQTFDYGSIAKELTWLTGLNLILLNLILTPMAAFTDDGLSWGDLVDINIIPTLFAIIYYGIARSRQFLVAYIDNRTLLERITNQHLQTELKFLKAQYHPHFLFNAINTIYFQMDDDLQGAKRTLEKFSELLRYQLYDQQQQVAVTQEIAYLNSFIELQKIRSSTQLVLTIDIDDQLQQQKVYPLLFLPLVENAFKYVGGQYLLAIALGFDENRITLRVSNSLPQHIPVTENAGGIGLENLGRRLQLLYPGKHKFAAGKQGDQFIAELQIEIEPYAA